MTCPYELCTCVEELCILCEHHNMPSFREALIVSKGWTWVKISNLYNVKAGHTSSCQMSWQLTLCHNSPSGHKDASKLTGITGQNEPLPTSNRSISLQLL